MGDKILVFESRRLSYDSASVFMNAICDELVAMGVEVERCKIGHIEDSTDVLERYIGKSYLAILDINSVLTVATYNESYYLDLIDAPFYNIIVDHPLHLHERLSASLSRYNVICIDKYHADYVRKYYPHIKNVLLMEYGAIKPEVIIPYRDRRYDAVFPATYVPPDFFKDKLKSESSECIEEADIVLEIMKANDTISIEDAYRIVCIDNGTDFPAKMHKARYIDRYVRTWYRDQVIRELVSSGVRVHTVGYNWDYFKDKNSADIDMLGGMDYIRTLDVFANAKMVVNIQPLFKEGPHDRVMNGMAAGAVVLTDTCEFLEEKYIDGQEIILYNKNRTDRISDIVNMYFDNVDRLEEIAERGMKKTNRLHTWNKRVQIILDDIYRYNVISK